jgi:hypothetical protein
LHSDLQALYGAELTKQYGGTIQELETVAWEVWQCVGGYGLYIFEPAFSDLIQAQANLGWSQIFQGRLALNWSRLQDEFLDANNGKLKLDRRYFTGVIWARKLISLLWTSMRTQWDLRNANRHR